jgi:hypothetical protein
MRQPVFLAMLLALWLASNVASAKGEERSLTLALRTRDPKTNRLKIAPLTIDPRKTGIVIVDMWNYHWCMTCCDQMGGMAYRMNKALQGARKLGMPVFWGPTDSAGTFIDWPQRQHAMAVPYLEVPKVRSITCRWTVKTGPCLCGPGIACMVNYGTDAMDERVTIADADLIVSGTQELYSLCKARGITQLIYFGGATNICLTGKDIGLGPMYSAGLDCCFARDMASAWTHYNPDTRHTPSVGNEIAADDLERGGIPTIHFVDELRKVGLWDERWITEPVRVTPTGKPSRPYFFEKSVAVSLDVPFLDRAEIRYTLDGSEPTTHSAKFDRPILLDKTTTLRAVAYRGGQRVSLANDGYFVHLPPRPPRPDVPIDGLPSVTDLYAKNGPVYAACLWQPRIGQSYEGKPLRIRATRYERGAGMRAPGYLRYELKPEYERFVALAGVDDNMLDQELGRNIAMYPSMVFKVFVDGRLAAESPVMRISQEPWRFDVPLPPGSRQIVLACTPTGHRDPYQLGNWVAAGFVTKAHP